MTLPITSEEVNPVPESISISNSGVSTWLVCQRQYYYKYDLAMEPIHRTEAIDRGVLGHDVLAVYYEERKNGASHDNAVSQARAFLSQFMTGDSFDLAVVLDVDRILSGYWVIAEQDNWRILQVESTFNVFLTPEFDFNMRLDLLIQDMNDGKVKLVDHKFVYNFKTQDEINLDPQMPKYVGALRANNVPVDSVIFNQLRYRKLKDANGEFFRRAEFMPPNNRVVNVIRDQITASQEIVLWKQKPLEIRGKSAKRILNLMVCRMCPVKSLCSAELDGAPIDYLMASDYKVKANNSSEPSSAELEALI